MNRGVVQNVLQCMTAFVMLAAATGANAAEDRARPPLTGLNIAGAEFGHLGGRYGFDYIYPTEAELVFAASQGFSVIRLPFLWERLQPQLGGKLDPEELGRLAAVVHLSETRGLSIILDPHNYARYFGRPIGSPQVPVTAFAQFWRELAEVFRDDPQVVFGLMNEPHDMPTEAWAAAASAAILAIRSSGAKNLVLVPGNAYSGAHSWMKAGYGTPNAVALRGITDPCNNIAFEFHQYLDANFSGTSPACPAPQRALDALQSVTDWLHETGKKGFLAEFAASERPDCLAAMNAMLQFMADHGDAWLGWTYWTAGAWWAPDYIFSVEPKPGIERPQLKILQAWRGEGGLPPHICSQSGIPRGSRHRATDDAEVR
ncbi:MAG: glycoside hydrolase family 5 protein [Beijerinckiaceae bacterium]